MVYRAFLIVCVGTQVCVTVPYSQSKSLPHLHFKNSIIPNILVIFWYLPWHYQVEVHHNGLMQSRKDSI